MKAVLFALMIGLGFLLSVLARSEISKPEQAIRIAEVYLGTLENGVVYSASVVLSNATDSAVRLSDIMPGCGCLSVSPNKGTLGPGKSLTLTVALNSNAAFGLNHVSVMGRQDDERKQKILARVHFDVSGNRTVISALSARDPGFAPGAIVDFSLIISGSKWRVGDLDKAYLDYSPNCMATLRSISAEAVNAEDYGLEGDAVGIFGEIEVGSVFRNLNPRLAVLIPTESSLTYFSVGGHLDYTSGIVVLPGLAGQISEGVGVRVVKMQPLGESPGASPATEDEVELATIDVPLAPGQCAAVSVDGVTFQVPLRPDWFRRREEQPGFHSALLDSQESR